MAYISDYLREALDERNIKKIRSALQGYFELNPAFRVNSSGRTDYDDAVSYIKSNYPELYGSLYEKNDPSIHPSDSASLKDQYYEISAALGMNFSKERVEMLRVVGKQAMNDANVYRVSTGSVLTDNTFRDGGSRSTYSRDNFEKPIPRAQTWQSSTQGYSPKKVPHQTKKPSQKLILVGATAIVVLVGIAILIAVRK